jgi:nucleotide-binding universal stress UspA family protein
MKRILLAYDGSDPSKRALEHVGSRGMGMLGRLLQGSVSEHVATHAHASVIIVK